MGRKEQELYDTMKRAMASPDSFLQGIVSGVDKAKCTCKLDVAGRIYNNVSLRSIITDDMGAVFYPEDNTNAVACRMPNSNRLFIIKMEKVESFHIKINDSELSGNNQGFTIKRGSESIKKILSDLMDAISQMTVTTGVGPSGTPINIASFVDLKARLNNILIS
jgi:hypothetical protein